MLRRGVTTTLSGPERLGTVFTRAPEMICLRHVALRGRASSGESSGDEALHVQRVVDDRVFVLGLDGVVDPADSRVPYYWRALNERNTPKPSIAQALAWYFKRTVYGANAGAHIEVLHHGHWVSSAK